MTFHIANFHVRLHYTWLIGFGLITWSLAANYFHDTQADLPVSYQWASGAIATLLILVSVFLHELAHAVTARRLGYAVKTIELHTAPSTGSAATCALAPPPRPPPQRNKPGYRAPLRADAEGHYRTSARPPGCLTCSCRPPTPRADSATWSAHCGIAVRAWGITLSGGMDAIMQAMSLPAGGGLRIPGAELLIPGSESMIPGVGLLIPGIESLIPEVGLMIPGIASLIPGVGSMIPGIESLFPGVGSLFPGAGLLIPAIGLLFR